MGGVLSTPFPDRKGVSGPTAGALRCKDWQMSMAAKLRGVESILTIITIQRGAAGQFS